MLWQLGDCPALTPQPRTHPWRLRMAVGGLAEGLAIAVRLASGVLARLRKRPAYFEPDPYATEAPFLSDRWPGQ